MGAKDTELSGEEAERIYEARRLVLNSYCCGKPQDYLEAVVEIQAEITWPIAYKAGQEQVSGEAAIMAKEAIEIALKEGRKGVVDWVESVSCNQEDEKDGQRFLLLVMQISVTRWQAKLKEWGID